MLFVASIQGEVSRKVSIGQAECDKRLNEVFQDSSKFHLKDKIDLEAQQELYSKLIEILASQDIEKKERLASFWANIQNRLNILSRQIEPQKKASYQVLYQNQTKYRNRNRNSGKRLGIYLGKLLEFTESQSASSDFIYTVREYAKDFIRNQRIGDLSLEELSTLRKFEYFLGLLSAKFLPDSSAEQHSLQENDRISSLEQRLKQSKNENKELLSDNRYLARKIQESESFIQRCNKRINDLSKQNEYYEEITQNPLSYLQECWHIKFIATAKPRTSKYHHSPFCPDWRSLAFEYIFERRLNPNSDSRFRISSYEEYFLDKEECSLCRKKRNT